MKNGLIGRVLPKYPEGGLGFFKKRIPNDLILDSLSPTRADGFQRNSAGIDVSPWCTSPCVKCFSDTEKVLGVKGWIEKIIHPKKLQSPYVDLSKDYHETVTLFSLGFQKVQGENSFRLGRSFYFNETARIEVDNKDTEVVYECSHPDCPAQMNVKLSENSSEGQNVDLHSPVRFVKSHVCCGNVEYCVNKQYPINNTVYVPRSQFATRFAVQNSKDLHGDVHGGCRQCVFLGGKSKGPMIMPLPHTMSYPTAVFGGRCTEVEQLALMEHFNGMYANDGKKKFGVIVTVPPGAGCGEVKFVLNLGHLGHAISKFKYYSLVEEDDDDDDEVEIAEERRENTNSNMNFYFSYGKCETLFRAVSGQLKISNPDFVRMEKLLEKLVGDHVEVKDACGRSFLDLAISTGNDQFVRYLVESGGFSVHSVDYFNNSPMHWACFYANESIAKYLLSRGAQSNVGENWLGYKPKEFPLARFSEMAHIHGIPKYCPTENQFDQQVSTGEVSGEDMEGVVVVGAKRKREEEEEDRKRAKTAGLDKKWDQFMKKMDEIKYF